MGVLLHLSEDLGVDSEGDVVLLPRSDMLCTETLNVPSILKNILQPTLSSVHRDHSGWLPLAEKWHFFLLYCVLFLGERFQSLGYKDHIYTSDFQLCMTNPDTLRKFRPIFPGARLRSPKNNTAKVEFLIFPPNLLCLYPSQAHHQVT